MFSFFRTLVEKINRTHLCLANKKSKQQKEPLIKKESQKSRRQFTNCKSPLVRENFEIIYFKSISDDKKTLYYANMRHQSFNNQIWNFSNLDLLSFEVMHGMSRINELVRDKLSTAMQINKENLPNDDGSFLITLVEDLVIFYQKRYQKHSTQIVHANNEQLLIELTPESFQFPLKPILNFDQVLTQMLNFLGVFKVLLANRDLQILSHVAQYISADFYDMKLCWLTYEKKIHVELLNLKRNKSSFYKIE